VLLLNASLTVRAKSSNSHAGKGWEGLTSAALQALAQQRSGIVFLLWGK
jgi:uracil-DNA glycosylase